MEKDMEKNIYVTEKKKNSQNILIWELKLEYKQGVFVSSIF